MKYMYGVWELTIDVVLLGNGRHRHLLEHLLVGVQVPVVRVVCVILDEFREVVRSRLVCAVDRGHVPVVAKRHGLGHSAVDNRRVPAESLHDEEVVELIVGLGVVGAHALAQPVAALAKRLPEVHDREVGKVGHSRDCFENVESGKIALVAPHRVKEADDLVHSVDHNLVEIVDPGFHRLGGWLAPLLDVDTG